MVDFGFEDLDEARFAEFLVVFRADDEGAGGLAEGAKGGWHGKGREGLEKFWRFRGRAEELMGVRGGLRQ